MAFQKSVSQKFSFQHSLTKYKGEMTHRTNEKKKNDSLTEGNDSID